MARKSGPTPADDKIDEASMESMIASDPPAGPAAAGAPPQAEHPSPANPQQHDLAKTMAVCVETCLRCAEACWTCADACLGEERIAELRQCIRLDLACAQICTTTVAVLLQPCNLQLALAQVRACIQACEQCGTECATHAGHHDHCRMCAEVCSLCKNACETLLREASPREMRAAAQ